MSARRTEDTEMSRLTFAAATATAPTYAAEIPVLIHQRLKDGAARNKATLTFAEKRVLVLGIGRRHASRKTKSWGISPPASLFVTGVAYRLPWRRSGAWGNRLRLAGAPWRWLNNGARAKLHAR
jgi:hypothetical protein